MSQYPYQPPSGVPYGYGYYAQDPLAALLGPAKRASVIMLVIGGLMLPCGGILGAMGAAVDFAQLPPESAGQIRQLEQQLASTGMTLKGLFVVMGSLIAVPGLLLIVLGVVVRRGGMGGVVTSIILCGLVGLASGLMLVSSLVQANGCGAAAGLVVGVAMIAAEVFLFQAAGRAGQLSTYRGMAGAGGAYPQGYGAGAYPAGYPQQQQQQQPYPGQGWGQAGQQQFPQQQQGPGAWGQQMPPPPPPPAPPSDREG